MPPTLFSQLAELQTMQYRHAGELIKSGIASHALRRRFDETWFSDAAQSPASAESLPVAMADTSDGDNTYLYVLLKRGGQNDTVVGEEVNVATIKNPGTPVEEVVPEDGFTVDEVSTLRGLVNELTARRQKDLPNLSDNLLAIVDK